MYKAKLWDEDKWDIHSGSYGHSKYGNAFSEDNKADSKYHEQKYGSKEKGSGSDYVSNQKRDEENKEKDSPFEELEEKPKDDKELKEEDIPFKAAKQIFNESSRESRKQEGRKSVKTIEEAIKKAIEDEKKVIVMDS